MSVFPSLPYLFPSLQRERTHREKTERTHRENTRRTHGENTKRNQREHREDTQGEHRENTKKHHQPHLTTVESLRYLRLALNADFPENAAQGMSEQGISRITAQQGIPC